MPCQVLSQKEQTLQVDGKWIHQQKYSEAESPFGEDERQYNKILAVYKNWIGKAGYQMYFNWPKILPDCIAPDLHDTITTYSIYWPAGC